MCPVTFLLHDSGATLRQIPVNAINGVGDTVEWLDLTAFQDAIKNGIPGQKTSQISISGPFSNLAAAASSSLSGSHPVLLDLPGFLTPLQCGATGYTLPPDLSGMALRYLDDIS